MNWTKEEFEGLYDQYAKAIYRFVSFKVASSEAAEDLASEVFTRLLKGKKPGEIKNIRAFLYKIARNVIADHYRAQTKNQTVSIEDRTDIPDSLMQIEKQVGLSLEMDRIKNALRNLSEDYQNYIIWRYIDELSISEIAEAAEKSEESVRVGIHRALGALREQLERKDGTPESNAGLLNQVKQP